MATITYLIKGKKEPRNILLRFKHGRNDFDITKSTGYYINSTDWNKRLQQPKQNTPANKNLTTNLNDLQNQILKTFNNTPASEICADWLGYQIGIFKNEIKPNQKRSDFVSDCITHVIETAHIRENSNNGLGLSKSRINSYKNLLNIFTEYQTGKEKIRVKDIDISFGKEFLTWLLDKKNYSESYARKKLDDLKTVCKDAGIDGIETNHQLNSIKGGKPKKESVIYLSNAELKQIEKTNLVSTAHQNARKWLLFGCHIGQRGGDLLKITKDNFVKRNGLDVIELKQQKTQKQVTIPVLDKTNEILKDGLPKPIAIQNLNNYLKEVCEIAGIVKPVQGSKVLMLDKDGKEIPKDKNGKYLKKGIKRTVSGTYLKHELITSHVCRRSFATNLYGILPTPLIMQITAHSTEKTFLQYIGKNAIDYAQQIADFYEMQKLKKDKTPQLNIVKEASSK